ncbi:MAG: ABC transporter ATP-binding protein [Phycisphaeraceae bacterium]|nr:ABC transporter ATP-binding protein [Phycisphaeraceae bacterium]
MHDVLVARSLSKSFGATRALDGASVSLRRGEWLGLLGPNGAGKTTLIRTICGRVRPGEGEVVLFGQRVDAAGPKGVEVDAARSRMGVVPQEIALYDALTARENIRVFGSLAGVGRVELAEREGWALAWTGLEDRADEVVRGFSGGMKRRLNIACAVLHKPEVLLLDEPTVGVDPQSRERIWEMLTLLKAGGTSLLLTTHQLDEAQRVCDRVVIIDHGKVIAEGRFDDLVARTIGPARRVRLTLDSAWSGEDLGGRIDGAMVEWAMEDVALGLPEVLEKIARAGRRVEDVHIEAPSLQAVFIHLTGRELRE